MGRFLPVALLTDPHILLEVLRHAVKTASASAGVIVTV